MQSVTNKASLRKGGCQPKADWRVVSTELIFMVAPECPAWRVYYISSPGGGAAAFPFASFFNSSPVLFLPAALRFGQNSLK